MLRQRLVAHRGYQKRYPENTLLAFREAIGAGALYIETDIQFSSDLQPVLCHDAFLARIGGVDGFVRDKTLSELAKTPAGEPFRLGNSYSMECLASLTDLVNLLEERTDIQAFVEIKEEAIDHAGLETVLEAVLKVLHPVAERTILISFSNDFLAFARERGVRRLGLVARTWDQVGSEHTQRLAPEFIFADRQLLPPGEDTSLAGPMLVVYEVADPAEAAALFDRGVDMVETFDIGGMIKRLASHAL